MKLIKYIWSLIISIIIFLILHYFLKNTNIHVPYILSSIAQGLASLVALLFVIIFFLCQSTRRISILDHILIPEGYSILFIFVASIIFPLIIMRIEYITFQINLSLFLCIFSLSLLFPFIKFISETIKEFGIRNIIAELRSLSMSEDTLKYRELLDDLLNIKPEDIVKMEPKMIINDIIVEIVNRIMITKYMSEYYKKASIGMLARIGNLCFKDEEKKECFSEIKEKIEEGLFKSCIGTGITNYGVKFEDLFELYLDSLYELLSNIKIIDEKIRYSLADTLINASFLNFEKFKGEDEKRQKILKEKILIFNKEGKIIEKEYKKAWEDLIQTIDWNRYSEKTRDKFEDYLNNLFKA